MDNEIEQVQPSEYRGIKVTYSDRDRVPTENGAPIAKLRLFLLLFKQDFEPTPNCGCFGNGGHS